MLLLFFLVVTAAIAGLLFVKCEHPDVQTGRYRVAVVIVFIGLSFIQMKDLTWC